MPTATRDGVSLYYERAGAGETVAFVGDAGFGAWQWGHQYEGVAGPREALVWDLRGTGRPDSPPAAAGVDTSAPALEPPPAAAAVVCTPPAGARLGGRAARRWAWRVL
jgi:hypothetical protein